MAAFLFLAIASGSAGAATQDGRFAVERSGQAMCSRFLAAKEGDEQEFARYLGFIEGYLSAANRYEPNTFDLTPWHNAQALILILSNHCEQNPQEALGVAVQRLAAAMLPLRLASHSALAQIENGSARVEVYDAIVKRAQDELARLGYYAGERDGQYSPAMKVALEDFQRSAGLDPSGLPDTPTLWVLLNP